MNSLNGQDLTGEAGEWSMAPVSLDFLDEICKLALFSAYIKDEQQPISLLLVAKTESFKSETLGKAIHLKHILYLSDATAFQILKDYGDAIAQRQIRHILIPDLIPCLSKRWETTASFVAFLNLLLAEGIIESRTYALHRKFRERVKCGIITGVTPGTLMDARHHWARAGFMSRLVPISWTYSEPTRVAIFEFITERKYKEELPWNFSLPTEDIEVHLDPELARKLIPYSYQHVEYSRQIKADEGYGFRFQQHLQRFAMSSALAEGRQEVIQYDIDKVISLSRYMNLRQEAV